MTEWWTYRPSDLLMFSEETYYRLFELYNRDVWPLQIVALVLGLACIGLILHGDSKKARLLTGILAVSWAWTGWAFLFERYATINWAAKYLAIAWFVQATLLAIGAGTDALEIPRMESWRTRVAFGLTAVAVVVFPVLAPLSGRGWTQAEMFGLFPDPTAVATVGVALLGRRAWMRGVLLVIPILWLVISGTTLWVLR